MNHYELEKIAGNLATQLHNLYGTGDAQKTQIAYEQILDTLCEIYCALKADEECR